MTVQSTSPSAASNGLSRFIATVDEAVKANSEADVLSLVVEGMRTLVSKDSWLAPEFCKPHPLYYQQYLLYADPKGRFSIVSFVWGPGQRTPVHDHGTWGVIGMLRGAEVGQSYRRDGERLVALDEEMLRPGDVTAVSPTLGDIHLVRNAYDDRVSISIHAYGVDIGKQRRHVFDISTGAAKEFVSGYANV